MNTPRLAVLSSLFLAGGLAFAAPSGPKVALLITGADPSPQKEQPDGSVKCPVTGHKVLKGKGVTARALGHVYRVEDAAAAKELEAHPDLYLQADGTPKNQ
ncbi:MAG: hypothetical protein HYZ13_02670 [Acidobacteria bacterium]|nr:hypothetical protein [Acidobacteriota bacterium]